MSIVRRKEQASELRRVINSALKGGALEFISMARNHVNDVPVRPDYFGPASYYPRRVDVGIRGVAELRLSIHAAYLVAIRKEVA